MPHRRCKRYSYELVRGQLQRDVIEHLISRHALHIADCLKKDKEDTISCIFIPHVDSALQSHYNDIDNNKKSHTMCKECVLIIWIYQGIVLKVPRLDVKLVCPIAHRLIGLWTLNCNDPPTASIWTVGLNAVLNRATNHSINHKKLYSPKLSPDIKGN